MAQRVHAQGLTTRPVPELVRELAVPASVGFFFHTMYNVVDTYYGGRISTTALSSLSVAFPVFFIIISVGQGLGTGATALIGTALGEGRREAAALYAAQAVSFGLAVSVLVTGFGIWASPGLFSLLGAEGEYLATATRYMRVIFAGSVFFILNYMLNAVLQAHGDTRSFRNFLIAGCLANIVLDPLFIYGFGPVPGMGFDGIALATVLIQAGGTAYLARRVLGRKVAERIADKGPAASLRPRAGAYLDIAHQGFPASVNTMTIGLGIFVITYFIAGFGKAPVAAYGIATRIEQIVLLPSIGLNVATLALVAQNRGAGRFDRVAATLRCSLLYGAVVMAAGTVLVYFGSGPLMRLFTDEAEVVAAGSDYLSISAFALYAYVVLFVHVAALQGVKRPMFAIAIGVLRQVVAPVAVFSVCTGVLDLGLSSIWWSILAIVWFAAGVAAVFARRVLAAVAAGEGGDQSQASTRAGSST